MDLDAGDRRRSGARRAAQDGGFIPLDVHGVERVVDEGGPDLSGVRCREGADRGAEAGSNSRSMVTSCRRELNIDKKGGL